MREIAPAYHHLEALETTQIIDIEPMDSSGVVRFCLLDGCANVSNVLVFLNVVATNFLRRRSFRRVMVRNPPSASAIGWAS